MHLMFKKGNVFDRSPFQYGTISMLQSRVMHYQEQMESVSQILTQRIDGNKNILIRILQSIDVEFNGDMIEFMNKVNTVGMDLSRTIGMTSNYGVGKIFHGTMYDDCDEIFIAGRNDEYMWTDLWYNWRNVASVSVIDHPITDMIYFMPGATGVAKITGDGYKLCTFFVDIALLYVQWSLYRGSKKDPSMEHFVTEIVYPNMMKSHIDIVMLNRTLMKLGIIEECTVKSNLPFHQTPVDYEMDRIINIVLKNQEGRRFDENLFISTIPGVFKENVLESIPDPSLMPTIQCMWATLASKAKRTSLILYRNRTGAVTGRGNFLARIKRTIIQNESQKRFDVVNGGSKIKEMFDRLVTEQVPK